MNRDEIELNGRCDWINWNCPICGKSMLAYQGIKRDYALLCQTYTCKNFMMVAHVGDVDYQEDITESIFEDISYR